MGLFSSNSFSSSVLTLVLFIVFFVFASVMNDKVVEKQHKFNLISCMELSKLGSYLYDAVWVGDEELPVSVDWRERGAVVHVKDQGQYGSCWAFSTIAAVEGLHKIATGELISLSEQELVDCCVLIAGKGIEDAFKFIIKNGGIDNETHYPYQAKYGKCKKHSKHSKVVNISGYKRVPANDERALQRVVARQPVSVVLEGRGGDFQNYQSGVFTGSCGIESNHAAVVVGYGTEENVLDYWIVKNSWGTRWGENGYMRIQRNVPHINGAGKCGIAIVPLYPTMKSLGSPVPLYPNMKILVAPSPSPSVECMEFRVMSILSLLLLLPAVVIYSYYPYLLS